MGSLTCWAPTKATQLQAIGVVLSYGVDVIKEYLARQVFGLMREGDISEVSCRGL